ncbi:hypothetical protein NHJ6243_009517 [Beauveria neobassiana]
MKLIMQALISCLLLSTAQAAAPRRNIYSISSLFADVLTEQSVCEADKGACKWDVVSKTCQRTSYLTWTRTELFTLSYAGLEADDCPNLGKRIARAGVLKIQTCPADEMDCKMTARLVPQQRCELRGQVIADTACSEEAGSYPDRKNLKCCLIAANEPGTCEALAWGHRFFCKRWGMKTIGSTRDIPVDDLKPPRKGSPLDKIGGGVAVLMEFKSAYSVWRAGIVAIVASV